MSPVVRCQGRYNYIFTDPRRILLCSLCIILAISVEEGKYVSSTVQVSKENEGEILGCPSEKTIPGQGLWDTNHLNNRMHGIALYVAKLSAGFNKQLLDYWGFIEEMY